MTNYLAIDIGGTYIKYALLNGSEQLVYKDKVPTAENIDQAIVQQIKQIVMEYAEHFKLSGIGISTAGIVNRDKGEIIYAGPTIRDYKGTNFKEALTSFGLPVFVNNDVDAALLGERWKGDVAAYDSIFCLTLGTGIGGARYNQGLIDGANFQANSIGYLLYEESTSTNYEMRASTAALNRKVEDVLGSKWSTKDVFEAAKVGDKNCEKLIFDWTKEIAKGIAQIILIADPACILIGGGVSQQGDYLLESIEQHIPDFLPVHFYKTVIQMATQQNDAALYGAVSPFFN